MPVTGDIQQNQLNISTEGSVQALLFSFTSAILLYSSNSFLYASMAFAAFSFHINLSCPLNSYNINLTKQAKKFSPTFNTPHIYFNTP